jgi:hypothetical protein
MKRLTLSQRIDHYLATAPRSRTWYDTKNRCWRPGHVYISKKAVMALFLAHRRPEGDGGNGGAGRRDPGGRSC